MSGIEELLQASVDRGAVPGAIAVLAGPEGVREEAAAGVLRLGQDAPVTGDTMFRYASMTKAMTSVAALQLVEQGRLELEQEVASVLPEFGELQVLEGFDGDEPRLRPPSRPATIRQLLTHTSGCGYWFSDEATLRFHDVTGTPTPLSGLKAALGAPLVADPGTRWEYGVSTDWLGLVVEAVSGQDLERYLREHVFDPLGMADATFDPTDEQRARMMAIHHRTPDGGLEVGDLDLPRDPEFWSGGGGAYGTARDYARFMAALLAGGGPILQPATVELAFADHLGGLPLPEVIRSAVPELTNDVPSLPVRQGWGLGFQLVLEDLEGMRRAGTGTWAGLFNSYFWIDRGAGVAGAILTQVLPFFDPGAVELALGVEQAAYAAVAA